MGEGGLLVAEICKAYGRTQVLSRLSFACRPGTITGLLGPNGSGKSTTMRVMLGLNKADSGTVTFGGVTYDAMPNPGRTVGSLLDPSAHHGGRSARETLVEAALLMTLPSSTADEALDRWGLLGVGRRRFGALSLGMKQRVALAIATMGEPQYLILDEPMNGLDIESSGWLRENLKQMAHDQQATVVISTHLLHKLQSFADRVVVLKNGAAAFEGDIEALNSTHRVRAETDYPDDLARVLRSRDFDFRVDPDGTFVVTADSRSVSRLCVESGVILHGLSSQGVNLEEAYLDITKNKSPSQGGHDASARY